MQFRLYARWQSVQVKTRGESSARIVRIGLHRDILLTRGRVTGVAASSFLLGKFTLALFFLFSFLFQISLTLFKRIIWFCQNCVPYRQRSRMSPYCETWHAQPVRRSMTWFPVPGESFSSDYRQFPDYPALGHAARHGHARRIRAERRQSRRSAAPGGVLH